MSEVIQPNIHLRPDVSLVIPVHNEAQAIERVITEFYEEIGRKIPLEIIISEDGSSDGTKEVLVELSHKIPLKLSFSDERRGYLGGAKHGLAQVTADFVLFVDSDGQYVASDFWKMYDKRRGVDLIVGRKLKRHDPFHRVFISGVFQQMIRAVFHLPLHHSDTGYRLMNRRVLDAVLDETQIMEYSFWTEFSVRAFKKGFRLAEVPVTHRARIDGSTRLYSPWKLVSTIIPKQLIAIYLLRRDLGRNQTA